MSGLQKSIDRQTSKTQNNEGPKSVCVNKTKTNLDLSQGKCTSGSFIPLLSLRGCRRIEFHTGFDWGTVYHRKRDAEKKSDETASKHWSVETKGLNKRVVCKKRS